MIIKSRSDIVSSDLNATFASEKVTLSTRRKGGNQQRREGETHVGMGAEIDSILCASFEAGTSLAICGLRVVISREEKEKLT